MTDSIAVVGATFFAILLAVLIQWRFDPLYSIPSIGPSWPLLSYIGAYRYFYHAREVLQEGYERYKIFRVAMLDKWVVVVTGPAMHEELRKIPDTHASFAEAVEEFIGLEYSCGPEVTKHQIHTGLIRGPLTRNLGILFGDVLEEIRAGFAETVDVQLGDNQWTHIDLSSCLPQILAHATNRVFVGLPLCREPTYLSVMRNFTFDVSRVRWYLSWTPTLLKGVVGRLLPWPRRARKAASALLLPVIREHRQRLKELDEAWIDKPNDLLMWAIEDIERRPDLRKDAEKILVQTVMVSNFAAIHSSSISTTHALYHLAAEPQYVQPLREEIEAVVHQHGWTKVAVGKMWNFDSFMREAQRLNGITVVSVMRKILQDVTLSDGTLLPTGTLVVGASWSTHHDARYYSDPNAFSPFRWAELREEDGENLKHQFVRTSPEYIAFGHGSHACPGRFFAANELKLIMAHIILNYDLKLEDPSAPRDHITRWHTLFPSPAVRVLFKKRQDVSAVCCQEGTD